MIPLEEVFAIHDILIKRFGGLNGIRDLNALEASVNMPFQTFGGSDLYPSIIEKVAALLESIIKNHPFIDGNKRLGYTLCRLILMNNQMDIKASDNDKFSFIIKIAENKFNHAEIVEWLNEHITK